MKAWPVALLAAILLLAACSKPTEVSGGGGVETTGGDLVALAGGSPTLAAGARVRLVPEDYVPTPDSAFPDSLTVIADDTGHYVFKRLPKGRYNLEAFLPKDGTRLLRQGLLIDKTTSSLGRDTLRTPARLSLRWGTAKPGILYVTGTTIVQALPTGETMPLEYLMDSLPAGLLPPLRHRPAPADSGSRILADSLFFRPGDTVRYEILDDWAHSARLFINTTAAGADVGGDVMDFPLLVRFFSGDFDFSEFATGGRDLRFTDPEGSPIPHQIQRWDSAGGKAEVWVRVPRVDGNSNSDHVVAHWGRKDAPDPKAEPVFDRAGGFTALWHLDENGNTKPAGYADELGLHPGSAPTTIDSTRTEALIVGGLKLDGSKEVVVPRAADLDSLPALTLSLWIKSESWANGDRTLIQKGGGLGQYGIGDVTASDSLEFRLSVDNQPHALRVPTLSVGDLHMVQATYDGQEARLYVDGVLLASKPIAGALTIASDNLHLGSKPGAAAGDPFDGLLDEIAIHHVARTPHWVKLAYETQKQNAKVLRIEAIK